jgi:hypothetical protein
LPEPDQGSTGTDPEARTSESGHPASESERPARSQQPATPEYEPPVPPSDSGPGPDSGARPDSGRGPDAGAGPLIRRGSVHLTMPLAAWLGLTRSPGDIRGFGPASAETCRKIADLIAQDPGSRWCLTLTDANGRAVGHGCARRPPGGTPRRRAVLPRRRAVLPRRRAVLPRRRAESPDRQAGWPAD